jgi:hypothetical protein
MKNLLICLMLLPLLSACPLNSQNSITQNQNAQYTTNSNRIQLALLLDVSSSMDGLINQAKAELWTIVNEVAKAKKNNENCRLEIALYEYGRSSEISSNGFVVKLLDYTSDLDTISKVLFGLTTNGGEEYCGQVIENALSELQWRDNDSIYRVIFIAGNEPFNQGGVSYQNSCEHGVKKSVFINTIYCGDSTQGVKTNWKDGATIGKGEYFFINQNLESYVMETPYDETIGLYNDSLNTTYWDFGDRGKEYKYNQVEQDKNAEKMSGSVKANRALSKTYAIYDNSKWDAVDALKNDSLWVENTKEKDLPKQLKSKSKKEMVILLDSVSSTRAFYSSRINQINTLREDYIVKNNLESDTNTLGKALIEAIHKQAGIKGFIFE